MAMSDPDLLVTVTYSQPRWRSEWAVPEVPVPESNLHDLCIEYLSSLLLAWSERQRRDLLVARNLGIGSGGVNAPLSRAACRLRLLASGNNKLRAGVDAGWAFRKGESTKRHACITMAVQPRVS